MPLWRCLPSPWCLCDRHRRIRDRGNHPHHRRPTARLAPFGGPPGQPSVPWASPSGAPVLGAHRQAAAQVAAGRADGALHRRQPAGLAGPGYESLIVARVLTGLAHGVFFSVGSTIATGLVPGEKAASAIAIMFSGLTVALVTGVPLGTWIGQQQFGWRETFLVVSALGVIAMASSLPLIPDNLPKGFRQPGRAARRADQKPVLLVWQDGAGLRRCLHGLYLPRPHPAAGERLDASAVSLILLVYGVSRGGRQHLGRQAADKMGPPSALSCCLPVSPLVLLMLTFTAPHPVLAVAHRAAWAPSPSATCPACRCW